jgi:thiamine kinase-like enzyme
MWDLADVSIEAGFSDEQDRMLLQFYFDRNAEPEETVRFYANKLYLDFLWALWGKTRVPFDGETMEVYAQERYLRLRQNLREFIRKFSLD